MLTPWANHIVLAALGLGIGTLFRLTLILTPPEFGTVLRDPERPGEGWFERARRHSDEQKAVLERVPNAQRASLASGALIAVLVLVVVFSPVELGWWTLLAAMAAGTGLVEVVYRLARSGKIRTVGGTSKLDPLAGTKIGDPGPKSSQVPPRSQP
jgi:hypothetical protein